MYNEKLVNACKEVGIPLTRGEEIVKGYMSAGSMLDVTDVYEYLGLCMEFSSDGQPDSGLFIAIILQAIKDSFYIPNYSNQKIQRRKLREVEDARNYLSQVECYDVFPDHCERCGLEVEYVLRLIKENRDELHKRSS